MVQYRTFRNTDPPRLVEVWNDTFTGRGAALLPNSTLLERYVFGKQMFDPRGLILACEEQTCLGFVHASRTPAPAVGLIALIGVRPAFRRRGIGSELLRRGEGYLRDQGARRLRAGGRAACNPFCMGLYGGSEPAGFLCSDAAAEPFLLHHGYRVGQRLLVLQRSLEVPIRTVDPRFPALRPRFDIQLRAPRALDGGWREAVIGAVDPLEASAVDRQSGAVVGRTLVWEMDGFSWRWQKPAVGILDFQVEPAYRRQGVGKLFFIHLLRQLQEQFFVVAELHLDEGNENALRLVRNVGFAQVDTGQVFEKDGG